MLVLFKRFSASAAYTSSGHAVAVETLASTAKTAPASLVSGEFSV